jgi:ankyrin repeat protein
MSLSSKILFKAIESNNVVIIKLLIQAGVNVDKAPTAGDRRTPLFIASVCRKTEIAALLIEAGADVNKTSYSLACKGVTPLSIASDCGKAEIAALLIEAGADVDKADDNGETPLYKASLCEHTEVMAKLIQARADVNKATDDGYTPLFIASIRDCTEAVTQLIEAGADVDKAMTFGATPLFVASQEGHTKIMAKLIQAGADVDKARNSGHTPLFIATYKARAEAVTQLIEAGADVDKATDDGRTPLHLAASAGNFYVVKLLVKNGAKIETQAKDGSTPISSARLNKDQEVASFLSELLRKPTADVDTSRQSEALEFERRKFKLQKQAEAERTATDDKPRVIRPTIIPSDTQALLAQYATPSAPGLASQPFSDATEEIAASRQTELTQPKTPPVPRTETSGMQVSFNISYEDLTFDQQIGEGGFGYVFSGTCRTFGQVAIKQFKGKDLQRILGQTPLQALMHEAEMMTRVRHPNIVSLWGISSDAEQQYSMVMEYMPKGSLYDAMHGEEELTWQQRWKFALDIGQGLCFLHEQGVLHHDLKSPNVLLDENKRAKISDFGLSKVTSVPGSAGSRITTQTLCDFRWKAPELYEPEARYDKPADVFSYGVILGELATKKTPMGGKPRMKTIPEDCPEGFREVIKRCRKTKPGKRCTIQEAVQILEARKMEVGLR